MLTGVDPPLDGAVVLDVTAHIALYIGLTREKGSMYVSPVRHVLLDMSDRRLQRFRHFKCRMLGIDNRQEVLGIENLTWLTRLCSREFSFN